MRFTVLFLTILLALVAAFGLVFCTTPADGDGDGDGNGDGNGDGDEPRLVWTFSTGGSVVARPVIADGRVYVGSRDYNLYCINAEDGTEVWRFAADGPILAGAVVGDEGLVFFNSHTDDGWESSQTLFCLNAASGTEDWSEGLAGVLTTGPASHAGDVIADGFHYPSRSQSLYRFASADGSEQWRHQSDAFVTGAVVGGGMVYLAEFNGGNFVTCLDADDGSVIWQSPATNYIHEKPELHGDFVYTADGFGTLACRDAEDGTLEWEYDSGTDFPTEPVAGDGYVVFAADDTVFCLDSASGAEVWTRTYDGAEIAGVVVADANVYFGQGSTVTCLAAADASLVWGQDVPGIVEDGVPAVADGFVYIGDFAGNVYCLRAGADE